MRHGWFRKYTVVAAGEATACFDLLNWCFVDDRSDISHAIDAVCAAAINGNSAGDGDFCSQAAALPTAPQPAGFETPSLKLHLYGRSETQEGSLDSDFPFNYALPIAVEALRTPYGRLGSCSTNS